MRRQYASSVYSQKSTASAKSGRSYLSLTTPIWPSSTTTTTTISTTHDISINEAKQSVWQNLKNWMPTKKKNDTDSITTTRSSSSINKLKQLFNNNNTKKKIPSPRTSIEVVTTAEEEESSSCSTTSTPIKKKSGPVGILVNNTESSAEAIAERKKRRHQRREHILKLQMHHRSIQQQQHPHHHLFHNIQQPLEEDIVTPIESSSSDTLLTTEDSFNNNNNKKMVVGFHQQEDDNNNNDWGDYNPRIMFVEPSPVPRFRNVAPPPPPSPPYLNILVNQHEQHDLLSILTDTEEPTIFTQRDSLLLSSEPTMEQPLYDEEEMSHLLESLKPKPTPKLYFTAPLYRGQILKFSLQNVIPEDHIILFKFLTSNTQNCDEKYEPERYFVRPSAGKITSNQNNDIVLFLNHVPTVPIKKDKIMIRWAVIQKHTAIETWVNSLHDSTRKKWIDMLDEQFPDQVTIRMTRIKIRFL
jgi:hypothetical protein